MESVLILLLKYKYLILFPLAAFEGPIISLMVGFLVFSGVFDFWLAYAVLLFGDIVPDTLYYYIGYFGERTKFIQRYFLKSEFFINHLDIVRKLWNKHTFKTMFFGKLASGMAIPLLVSAGIVKLPYKRFISNAIPVTLFQYGALMFLGYYMGSSYEKAIKYIDYVYLFMAILIIFFIIIYIFIIRYARKKIISMESMEKK